MRIAYFNATMRVGQDGVTRVVYKMIESALARRAEVIAFSAALPAPEQRIIPMYKVPSLVLPLQKVYRLALPGYQTFAKRLQNFRPDILHINSPCPLGFAATRYAKRFNVPIVATYHTHFPTYPRYYKLGAFEGLTWSIMKSLYGEVNRTFVPTMPILCELQEHGISRLEYLPHGVETQLFNPENRSTLWRKRFSAAGKPVLLFVSRLVWEKDLRVLAEMYNILRSRRDDFAMVVVGDGHARAQLETTMPGAHFLGYQKGSALAESYASADIFVFPSTTETFGLVTLEAMASGLAPVAADAGGAKEIIEEGKSGLLAVPLDSVDLAKKVEWLLDHPDQRTLIAQHAFQRAQEFGWPGILDRLFASYEEVVQEFENNRKGAAYKERLLQERSRAVENNPTVH